MPKKEGGTDEILNLITACRDCNRGKAARKLTVKPEKLAKMAEITKEREVQFREYQEHCTKIEKRANLQIEKVNDIFIEKFKKYEFSERFRLSVKKFLGLLTLEEVKSAMVIACSEIDDPLRALKYFCGICWKKIKG